MNIKLGFLLLIATVFVNIPANSQVLGWTCLVDNTGDTLRLNGTISRMLKTDDGQFYITGNFTNNGPFRYVAKWNDTTLSVVDSSVNTLHAYSSITNLCEGAKGTLYASCSFDGMGKWYVAKWDGSKWTPLGTGPDTLDAYYIIDALCADTQGNVYVSSMTAVPNSYRFVSMWNGSTWTKIATDTNLNGRVLSMCTDRAGNLYVAGYCTNGNGKKYVARWTGSGWVELGAGSNPLNANDIIRTIYCDANNNVYAVGDFTNAGGYRYVARWDGNVWHEVGTGTNALNANDIITAIYVDSSGQIYVGGAFKNATGNSYVAQWDGTSWTEVGSGIYSLNASGIGAISPGPRGDLYALGGFRLFNQNEVHNIAKFTDLGPLTVNEINTSGKVTAYPNPTLGAITLKSDEVLNGSYYICDVKGSIIRHGRLNGKLKVITFDDLPGGTYMLRVDAGAGYSFNIRKL